MATYRQTKTVYESDYGDVTIDIIIADSYDNIFSDTYYSIDIVDFKDVDKKLENAIGQLSTDQATFEIDESTFKMNDDTTEIADSKTQLDIDNEALTLCKTSTSTDFNYIALFVNTSATPVFDDALFIGAIDYDYEEEYLTREGGDYATTWNPLKLYKFKTTPIQESLFDAISLQTVIDAAKTAILSNQANVLSAGYEDGDYKSVTPNIIAQDVLLKILTDEYVSQLDAGGYGTFTITYTDCFLDGKMFPARFRKPLAGSVYGHYCSYYTKLLPYENVNYNDNYVDIFGDEGVSVKFIGSTPATLYEAIYVSTTNILKPSELPDNLYNVEVLPETAEDLLWQNNERVNDSFTGLLYSLATDYGLTLQFTFTSQTNIVVSFKPKSSLITTQMYLKNAEKASNKKFNLEKREEEQLVRGVTSHLTSESEVAENVKVQHLPIESITPANKYNEGDNVPRSLIGMSTPLWTSQDLLINHYAHLGSTFVGKSSPSENISGIVGATIPYNTVLYQISTNTPIITHPVVSISMCHCIYLVVDKRLGETYAPSSYITPIAMYRTKHDGIEREYYTLEDYRRSINNYDNRTYGRELNLSVPYLMAFSNNSSGTGADIKNLTLGRKIVLDTVEYVVTGFKINIQDWKVDIKLENTGRFDYGTPVDGTDVSKKINATQGGSNATIEGTEIFNYIADGDITKGQLVSLKTATTVEPALARNTHYNRIIGIALNDADDTEGVNVQVSGKVVISGLGSTINAAVFVREVSSTVNTSTTQLTGVTGSEDYYLEVGRVVATDTLDIKIKEGFVLQ